MRGRAIRPPLAALALAAALAACGLPSPEPLPRVAGASPSGQGVPTGSAAAIWFDAPVDPDGLLDGRRLVLVEAALRREAEAAVDSDAGAAGLSVPAAAAAQDGGRRIVLRPDAPLHGFTPYALVLSSRTRAADGRPVLDPEGRRRTFVATFETGAPDGPPPRPVLTEARARAATPEAGGEYVEVANLGVGPLDLAGYRLSKRTAAGALVACTIGGSAAPVPPGGVALVAGGAWDGRYALPAGVPVLGCGASALLGGLADDRPVSLRLSDPAGGIADTLGEAGAPLCPVALERVDPAGPDLLGNLACTAGSPGLP